MKAEFKTRSPVGERIDLSKAIPIISPLTVQVEVASVCNLRCVFCPTGDPKLSKSTGKFRGLMALEIFEKIIQDINEFPVPISTLHLHKDGEPLVHPEFCDMVSIARRSNKIKKIETLTNGVLLTPELNERLANSGLDRIKISVYGLDDHSFKEVTRENVDFDRYVNNIADLYNRSRRTDTEIYIKIMEGGLSLEKKALFLDTFGDISDTIFFEHCVDNWPGFKFEAAMTEVNVGILGQSVNQYKKVCPQPFYNLTVNSDGQVSACCADWEVRLVVGNVFASTLSEIWNGKLFNDFRLMMLKGERESHPVCANCGYPTFTCVDDFDDAAEEIIKRLK